MSLSEQLGNAQGALSAWFAVLAIVNLASFIFAIWDVRARWMAASVIALSLVVMGLYQIFGYTRILGLGHIIVWVPLFIYLWPRRKSPPHRRWTNLFIVIFLLVNGVSFALDSVDLIRYLLGDRSSY